MSRDWSSYVLVRNPTTHKIICVRKLDPETGLPRGTWHLPGGKRDHDDAGPIRTAIGELQEEVGITAGENHLKHLETKRGRRKRHGRVHKFAIHYFVAEGLTYEEFSDRAKKHEGGEEVRELTWKQIQELHKNQQFMHTHFTFLSRVRFTERKKRRKTLR